MGASMSTLGGWTIVLCIAGYYAFRYVSEGKRREAARAAAHKQRLEDRQNLQNRKDNKDKAKQQRTKAFAKDTEEPDKASAASVSFAASKPKARPSRPSPPAAVNYSSDDGVDNREFARQLASVKQGTDFAASRKNDEKRQKSVKQSRAQEKSDKVSAPSSTAGVDADDDQSPLASPDVRAINGGSLDVSDMLERPEASGPSVLRLTDTEKTKPRDKKAKAPEKTETKKQRQNRLKAEAAKAAREESEKDRRVKMEAQRRLARISENRAAKDGSGSAAPKPTQSAWAAGSATNGSGSSSNGSSSEHSFVPVQPLDTFGAAATEPAEKPRKEPAPPARQADSWMSSLPSEEEQMEMLREEEGAWSTVKTKKASKSRNKGASSGERNKDDDDVSNSDQAAAPAVSQPAPAPKARPAAAVNGKPAKTFTQPSAFAALSEPEVEEEWDV